MRSISLFSFLVSVLVFVCLIVIFISPLCFFCC